jgi:hypothetical protein
MKKVHGDRMFHPCCDDKLMGNFLSSPDKFCLASFQSYQVLPSKFPTILETCQRVYEKQNVTNHRMQLLVSIREPISRTLSFIHQQCNRNGRRRPKELLQACNRCNFDQDKDVWLGFADRTNKEYEDIHSLMASRVIMDADEKEPLKINRSIPVLALDLDDLSPFFQELKGILPDTHNNRFHRKSTFNKEELDRCNFHMSSEMIKALSKSTRSYRNLTLGVEEMVQV